jgi:hypothetical protein
VDRDMVMRNRREGGVGHLDPVQYARHSKFDPDYEALQVIQDESGADSESSLPEEEGYLLDQSNEEDEDTESFELITSDKGSSSYTD